MYQGIEIADYILNYAEQCNYQITNLRLQKILYYIQLNFLKQYDLSLIHISKGWLPPSLQSKTDHHIRWIKKLQDLLPEGYRLSIELGRFDPARLKDPEIHGELYQKGPQYDYENVRAYVLNRDRYTCQVCGKKGGKLHVHHILYRSHGATDDPQYMATVCSDCHNTENHQQGGILYQWMQKQDVYKRQAI